MSNIMTTSFQTRLSDTCLIYNETDDNKKALYQEGRKCLEVKKQF